MSAIAGLATRQVFFLGVNTGYVRNGLPDARFLNFYARRSSSNLHCAIVGNVVVPGGHASNEATPLLNSDAIWSEIASAIASGGSCPGIQLATVWEGYIGSRKFVNASSDVVLEGRRMVLAMKRDGISSMLDAFEAAVNLALSHGFAHIQLHAAHGYLLSLLIDARINPDADFVLHRLAVIGTLLRREGIESSIRISLRNGDIAFDTDGMAAFQQDICRLPFDFIDLSSGYYNIDKRLIYPARPSVLAQRLEDSVDAALRHPECQFIVSGRALHYNWTELPKNIHPGICRDLIANPNVLDEPANGCQNHNKCHYYSRGEPHLTCARWVPGTSELKKVP